MIMIVRGNVVKKSIVVALALTLGVGAMGLGAPDSSFAKGKIAISKKSITLTVGKTKTLKLKNITSKQSKKVKWKSTKKSVAKVSQKGVVKAVAKGSATIKATYKKKNYKCKVKVKEAPDDKTYKYNEIDYIKGDKDIRVKYSDDLLVSDTKKYNKELAKCSLAGALLSGDLITEGNEGALEKYMQGLGFKDFDANDDYKTTPTNDSIGVACANKAMDIEGRATTVISVVIRSLNYGAEWVSNLNMGTGETIEDHEGFSLSKDKAIEFIKSYIEDKKIVGNVRFWFMGHSRGSAVGNLSSAYIEDHPDEFPSITYDRNDVLAYLFATPNAAYNGDGRDIMTDYLSIHNIMFEYDFVVQIPPASFGFGKYGQVMAFNKNSSKQSNMMKMLKKIDTADYNLQVTYQKGIAKYPDGKEWLAGKVEALAKLVEDRVTFTKDWQKVFLHILLPLFKINISGLPDLAGEEEERSNRLLQLFWDRFDGIGALIADHYATAEYAWLCA